MPDLRGRIYGENNGVDSSPVVKFSRNCGVAKAFGISLIKLMDGMKEVEVTSMDVDDLKKFKTVVLFCKKMDKIDMSMIELNGDNFPSFKLSLKTKSG